MCVCVFVCMCQWEAGLGFSRGGRQGYGCCQKAWSRGTQAWCDLTDWGLTAFTAGTAMAAPVIGLLEV